MKFAIISGGFGGDLNLKLIEKFPWGDRKSTRLNSSHLVISYAVFCLKKKKHTNKVNKQCKTLT